MFAVHFFVWLSSVVSSWQGASLLPGQVQISWQAQHLRTGTNFAEGAALSHGQCEFEWIDRSIAKWIARSRWIDRLLVATDVRTGMQMDRYMRAGSCQSGKRILTDR